MPHQLAAAVAGGPQCSDRTGFTLDRISGRHTEDESQNCHDDIQHRDDHHLIAADVISGEDDCLVVSGFDKISQKTTLCQNILELITLVGSGGIAQTAVVVDPGIGIFDVSIRQPVKGRICHAGDCKGAGIEHHIRIVLKQRAVI